MFRKVSDTNLGEFKMKKRNLYINHATFINLFKQFKYKLF